MVDVVTDSNEVILNGVRYPISSPVQTVLASVYPAKVIAGDISRDSNPNASVLSLSSWRGGIGVHQQEEATSLDRPWWSTCSLRYRNHLVLPGLATLTAASGASETLPIGAIGELSDEIYVAFGTDVRKYNNTTDTWGSSLHTLTAEATDSITVRMNGVVYLVFTTTSGFSYTSDGTTWVDSIIDAVHPTFWDDKLYLIDATGRLKYTSDLGESVDESGTVTAVETDGAAALDDTGAVFTASIRDGHHWVRVHDNAGHAVTGYIGTADPDGNNTRVYLFNSEVRTVQNWVEGGATAFNTASTPLTFEVYSMTDDAQLPLPDDSVTDLLVGRNASGDPIIYAATKVGLFAHNADDTTFSETELSLPLHPSGGQGTDKWRDSIYYPAGLGLYKYVNGTQSAVVGVMGPDRDDGLPSDKRGTIRQLIPTHNELLALVDGTTAASNDSLNTFEGSSMGSHISAVIEPSQGYSSILGWDEAGWEVKWLSGVSARAISSAHVSNAYDVYRLWWALGTRVYYMRLPADIINPSQVTDFEYAAASEHITPWFNMGQLEVDKLALRLKVDVQEASATETVTVSYGTNLSESWTALGTVTSDGVQEYDYPNTVTPVGTTFRWIRFKLELARGSDTQVTPQVHNVTLEYRKKLPVKWGHQVELDIGKDYKGKSPKELRAALQSAISSATLLEFVYKANDAADESFFVDVAQVNGLQFSGRDYRGKVSLMLVGR